MQEIALKAEKDVLKKIAKQRRHQIKTGELNINSEDEDELEFKQDPHEWVKVEKGVRRSRHWNIASRVENVQDMDIRVVRSQLNRNKLKNLMLSSPT